MSTASRVRGSAQVFKAVLIYFGVIFGTGFVLGTIRVLWSVPRFGERNAEFLEQPLMLIAVILAARGLCGPVCAYAVGGFARGASIEEELTC